MKKPTLAHCLMYGHSLKGEWFTVADLAKQGRVSTVTGQRFINFLLANKCLEKIDSHPAPQYRLIPNRLKAANRAYFEEINRLAQIQRG